MDREVEEKEKRVERQNNSDKGGRKEGVRRGERKHGR